jgi:aromatic ring-opening dioxygenase catalytic subunit (LigB family)
MTAASRMPTLYIPHGAGPCFFMDWNPPDMWTKMGYYLRDAMADLPAKPKAIVMVSAHWEEARFTVGSAERPGMLFDYSGFPQHTYQFRYGSHGSPELAARVRRLLSDAGLPEGADDKRGYDHGMFIPLMLMAPAADIPVIQLSLRSGLDPQEHAAAGRALLPLRDEGVFIVGSGMSYHNMRGYGRPESGPVSDRFDDWLTEAVAITDPEVRAASLAGWAAHPDGRASHPREEHLIPLMVVAGCGGTSAGRRVFSDRVMETTVSAFQFD